MAISFIRDGTFARDRFVTAFLAMTCWLKNKAGKNRPFQIRVMNYKESRREWQDDLLIFAAALDSASQGDFIRIFQIGANGNATRNAGNF